MCECWEQKLFGDARALASLSRARAMRSLEIDFLGEPDRHPSLLGVTNPCLQKVTLRNMDFDGDDGQPTVGHLDGFGSTVGELVFDHCSLSRVPALDGFQGLRTLTLNACVFTGDAAEGFTGSTVLRCLSGAPIEVLVFQGCDGVLDGSPFARMPRLKRLTMVDCAPEESGSLPDFSDRAIGVLKAKILGGELAVRLCNVVVNRLKITRTERQCAVEAIELCGDACCEPCDCGQPDCATCPDGSPTGSSQSSSESSWDHLD